MVHVLKLWPEFFAPTMRGEMTAQARVNDRVYQLGDTLELREWNPETKEYTGRYCVRKVTHVLQGGQFGVAPGHVLLSLAG